MYKNKFFWDTDLLERIPGFLYGKFLKFVINMMNVRLVDCNLDMLCRLDWCLYYMDKK